MGLTELEYREFLAVADSVVMRPAGAASIQIEGTPAGWRFGSETTIPELRGIEIDTVADLAKTSFGTLTTRTNVSPSDGQRATGRWTGVPWRHEESSANSAQGVSARLAIGKLEVSGQTLVFFDGKRMEGGQVTLRSTRVVRWE